MVTGVLLAFPSGPKKSVIALALTVMSVMRGGTGTEGDRSLIGREKALEIQVRLPFIVHWLQLCHVPPVAKEVRKCRIFLSWTHFQSSHNWGYVSKEGRLE